jgi:hypothetical protein
MKLRRSRPTYDPDQADRVNAEARSEVTSSYGMARRRYCKHSHDIYEPANYRFASDGRRICLRCRDSNA